MLKIRKYILKFLFVGTSSVSAIATSASLMFSNENDRLPSNFHKTKNSTSTDVETEVMSKRDFLDISVDRVFRRTLHQTRY